MSTIQSAMDSIWPEPEPETQYILQKPDIKLPSPEMQKAWDALWDDKTFLALRKKTASYATAMYAEIGNARECDNPKSQKHYLSRADTYRTAWQRCKDYEMEFMKPFLAWSVPSIMLTGTQKNDNFTTTRE